MKFAYLYIIHEFDHAVETSLKMTDAYDFVQIGCGERVKRMMDEKNFRREQFVENMVFTK